LSITDLKVGIQRGARSKTVEKLFKEADVAAKWGKTSWAKRTEARAKRVTMNDFDRFKAMLAKKHVRCISTLRSQSVAKLYIHFHGITNAII
jgi:large subunit ribosomal protein L14e